MLLTRQVRQSVVGNKSAYKQSRVHADGCPGCPAESIELHNVTDLRFRKRAGCQMLPGGTIEIISSDEMFPYLKLHAFRAAKIYESLHEVCVRMCCIWLSST
jgi:hypothetical protein